MSNLERILWETEGIEFFKPINNTNLISKIESNKLNNMITHNN